MLEDKSKEIEWYETSEGAGKRHVDWELLKGYLSKTERQKS